MKFTDKQLREFKKKVPLIHTYSRWLTTGDEAKALLHRLECAEKALDYMIFEDGKLDGEKLFKAWRSSKGE